MRRGPPVLLALLFLAFMAAACRPAEKEQGDFGTVFLDIKARTTPADGSMEG